MSFPDRPPASDKIARIASFGARSNAVCPLLLDDVHLRAQLEEHPHEHRTIERDREKEHALTLVEFQIGVGSTLEQFPQSLRFVPRDGHDQGVRIWRRAWWHGAGGGRVVTFSVDPDARVGKA